MTGDDGGGDACGVCLVPLRVVPAVAAAAAAQQHSSSSRARLPAMRG